METVAFCEFDKKAQLVLKKHWPEIPIYDDIRELTGEQIAKDIGAIDLICGGFPCQPFSVAGKQRGDQDDRHLWPEMFRLIQEVRPRWVIGENVAGLISMGLDQVLSDLESADYSCEAVVIPACAKDAPHRRDRVWILAFAEGIRLQGDIKPRGGDGCGSAYGRANKPARTGDAGICENVANSDIGRVNRCPQRSNVEGELTQDNEQSRDRWTSENNGYSWWLPESGIRRVANGVPNRVDRIKQLGNAVVPQVVEEIGRAIMQIENNQPGE